MPSISGFVKITVTESGSISVETLGELPPMMFLAGCEMAKHIVLNNPKNIKRQSLDDAMKDLKDQIGRK